MSDKPSNTWSESMQQWLVTEQNLLLYLLLSLVFILLVVPTSASMPFAAAMLRLGIMAVLVCAAVATRRRRRLLAFGLLVAAVATPANWLTMFVDQPYLFAFCCALDGLFFAGMAGVILASVIRKHLATINSIYGSICAYLLLGLAWAFLYWGLDFVDDRSLQIGAEYARVTIREPSADVAAFSQFIYFSFVTMSTLGYGDITPQTPLAQTLTWMQSVTGQFYIAVLVAWLVSEIPKRRRDVPL